MSFPSPNTRNKSGRWTAVGCMANCCASPLRFHCCHFINLQSELVVAVVASLLLQHTTKPLNTLAMHPDSCNSAQDPLPSVIAVTNPATTCTQKAHQKFCCSTSMPRINASAKPLLDAIFSSNHASPNRCCTSVSTAMILPWSPLPCCWSSRLQAQTSPDPCIVLFSLTRLCV